MLSCVLQVIPKENGDGLSPTVYKQRTLLALATALHTEWQFQLIFTKANI